MCEALSVALEEGRNYNAGCGTALFVRLCIWEEYRWMQLFTI